MLEQPRADSSDSRSGLHSPVDPQGGEIDIAWLVPNSNDRGGWLLFSRDHAQDCWQMRRHEASLPAVLAHLCADPDREFWQ